MLHDPRFARVLVFTRTKHGADRVVRHLAAQASRPSAIHGNKSQPQRERALAGFRDGQRPGARRHRHRRPRHRCRRRVARDQFRSAQRAGRLCSSHRPYRASRRGRDRDRLLQRRRAAPSAQHRKIDAALRQGDACAIGGCAQRPATPPDRDAAAATLPSCRASSPGERRRRWSAFRLCCIARIGRRRPPLALNPAQRGFRAISPEADELAMVQTSVKPRAYPVETRC